MATRATTMDSTAAPPMPFATVHGFAGGDSAVASPIRADADARAAVTPIRPIAPDAASIVVVGNGMVGYWFCRSLAQRDPLGRFRVTVFGEEPRPAYDRVNLTDLFSGKSPDDLRLAGRDWYARHSIELVVADTVVAIDPRTHTVTTASGRTQHYDHLVLATGSQPYVPDVPGTDLPNVFVYRTIEDVKAIYDAGRLAMRGAVIGGGLLGLEAAKALYDMGVKVTVLERTYGLMARQLDPASASILKAQVTKLGIDVKLAHRVERITQTAEGLRLCFENGKPPLDVDLVIIAVGIRPRDELARAAGLDVAGIDRGIIVDDTLTTSDPHISAIGECVRHRGEVYGLVAPGYEMAQVLVDRIVGDKYRMFEGGDLSCRLKLMGVTVGVFGQFQAECRSISRHRADSRRSLLIQGRRLIGATVVGEWSQLSRVQQAVEQQRIISSRQIERFVRTGNLWRDDATLPVLQWPASRLVCNCLKIDRGTLSQQCGSLRQRGEPCSAAALAACTGAGTVCKSCLPLLAELAGAPEDVPQVRGRRIVYAMSIAALLAAVAIVVLKPMPYAQNFSVDGGWYQFAKLWRVGWVKQLTGYSLLGVSAIGLLLSLRKRVGWMRRLGDFGWYRAMHTTTGLLCLIGLVVHTGMRMGANLNFALMCVFLGLNLLGAVAGVATAVEAKGRGAWALRARQWRPWLTWMHLVLFWPLPILVAFHVAVVYLY